MAAKKTVNLDTLQNIITVGLYGGKSFFRGVPDSKYRAEVVTCDCANCSLRDKGMCLKVTSPMYHTCVYGQKHIYEGFTPKAAACQEWNHVFKTHDRYSALQSLASGLHFAVMGDYYFVYTTYVGVKWNEDGTYKFETSTRPDTHVFIEKSKADADFFVDLLTYKPHALMGGEIKDYRYGIITLILKQMREQAPELYAAVVEAEPLFGEIEPNFLGKYVYVKSLKPDIDINLLNHGLFHLSADRKTLTCEDYRSVFLPFGAKTSKMIIQVTDDMTYKVQSSDEVCEDTEIAK